MTATATDFASFLDAGPSPFHCVAEAQRRLDAAGFHQVDEAAAPAAIAAGSGGYVIRGGSLCAWRAGSDAPAAAGFRLVGAHTDSPNLRVKPRPDTKAEGYHQLGVEVYGGVLLATWADRDLGISGQVLVEGEGGAVASRLVRIDRPIARIPNLAIHLNRKVNDDGLKLNAQKHLPPVLGQGDWAGFAAFLAAELGVARVLGWDVGLHPTEPAAIGGVSGDFVFSPRLDNEASCYYGLMALLGAAPTAATQVLALFDHEEVGSRSYSGAMGPLLRDVLERLVRDHEEQAPGGLARAAAQSWMASSDMAHGVHPNFADVHEPLHKPALNGGPVIKAHAELRYATTAESAARFRQCCDRAGVPSQDFVTRTDLACGSTIGPISSAELGIRTVDVGCAMLSMHSIREQCGARDVAMMTAALGQWFEMA
jgi:aspartyl aminopeptidase